MSEEPTSNPDSTPNPEPVETFYEDPNPGKRHFRPFQQLCDARNRVRDRVLKTIPVEVTEHLVNSRREFFMAGIALGEAGVRQADDLLKRARELHQK